MSGNEGKALLDEELLGKFVIGREFELEQKNQGEKAPVKVGPSLLFECMLRGDCAYPATPWPSEDA